MIYGYARVSTKTQASDGNSLEAQEAALIAAGAEIIYRDAFTGTKNHRPELDRLMESIRPKDTLIVTKLDRIARNTIQGIELITRLLDQDINVHILNMGLMDNTPTGRLIRTILLAFAEFERDMIIERTQEGKAVARKQSGFREGRPPKFSRVQKEHAVKLLKDYSYKQVSEMTGMSVSTVKRAKIKEGDVHSQ